MPGEPFVVMLGLLLYVVLYFSHSFNFFSPFFFFFRFFREPKIVNGPEILDKYVGESEANIRKVDSPN
jgi:hypothetical protein